MAPRAEKGKALSRQACHEGSEGIIVEIAFSEWAQNGRLYQPRFEGLRSDKTPRECRRERPETGIQSVTFHDDEDATGSKTGRNVTD
jgi:ATP-dependent DNA ligase